MNLQDNQYIQKMQAILRGLQTTDDLLQLIPLQQLFAASDSLPKSSLNCELL